MTDAANTVGTPCLGVWADPRATFECKSSPSELVTVREMKAVMERLVINKVNKTFSYGLTSDDVLSTSYPDVDMDTDLRTLEKITIIVQPNAAARERLLALPSMTEMSASKQKLQHHLDAEKNKVSILTATGRQLHQKLKEKKDHEEAAAKKQLDAETQAQRESERKQDESERKQRGLERKHEESKRKRKELERKQEASARKKEELERKHEHEHEHEESERKWKELERKHEEQ